MQYREINQKLSKCLMEVTSVVQLLLCTAVMQGLSVYTSSPGSVAGLGAFSDQKLMPKLKRVGLTG